MYKITLYFVFVLGVAVDEAIGKALRCNEKTDNLEFSVQRDKGDSDEIVGGDVVDIKQYPYQVSVDIYGKPYCGGSIIGEEYVLTAAHCVQRIHDPRYYQIRAGTSYIEHGGEIYYVSEIYKHPKYSRETLDYDVAVLKLTKKIVLDGKTTKIVQLPDSGSSLKPKDNIVVTGWGNIQEAGPSSDVLRAVTVPVISKEECAKKYNVQHLSITDRMLCAGLDEGGKDACQGDSGGPAVAETSLIQYGIVSFGIGCAQAEFPGVYTYVSHPPVRDWIKKVSGI